MNDVAAAPAPAALQSRQRDVRIDFLRGLALIFIFVDHVPDSLFSLVTPRSYAFADAAELFFFLSGFVAAMVYGRIAGREGAVAATRKIWRRAFVLYGAQLLLFAFVLAEISLAVAATGHAILQRHFRFDAMLTEPGAALTHAMLLRYQPAYLDILPLYVLFLAAFPLVLMGLARNLWLVLLPSAALWLGVQIWAVTLHTYPSGDGWFFNPLAWQFLFVLGAALGHPRLRDGWRFTKNLWLVRGALLFAGLAALVQIPEALRMLWPGIASLRPDSLPFDKSALEPLRIISFLSLALLAARYMPDGARLARRLPGRLLISCGRNSLQIFSAGVVLAVAGGIVAEETGHSLLIQFIVSLAGIAALCALARYLDGRARGGVWLRLMRRLQPA